MVKVWFPNMFMRLISVNVKKKPPTAVLYVSPKMTKFEISQYLTKIYNVAVSNVNTENILGKWKRLYGKKKVVSYKRRNFKRAIVEFDNSSSSISSSISNNSSGQS